MDQVYKCYSSCWGLLSLPRSSANLINTFSEMILWALNLPSGLTLDQENSEYHAQCHSLQSFQPCFSFFVPLNSLGMQVQWTIYCLKSPFLDQILLMHHQEDFIVFHIIPLVYIRVVLDLLYSISHKNFKFFCGASDICQHHLTIYPKPFCNVPIILFFPY